MEFETKIHNLPIIVEYEIFNDEIVDIFGEIELGNLYRVQLGFGGKHENGGIIPQQWTDEFITDSDWDDIREQAKADFEGVKIDEAGYSMEDR